jgi:tetratricopeptide (TPR) repeat protein
MEYISKQKSSLKSYIYRMKKIVYSLFAIIFISSCNSKANDNNLEKNIIVHHTIPKVKNPECIKFWNLALNYTEKGDFKKANELLLKCDKLEPNHATILNSVGVSYFGMGDTMAALKYYYTAIAADSLTPEAYAGAGVVLEQMKKYNESLKILKLGYLKTNLDQFTHYNICMNLAVTYYKMDSCVQAKKYITIARKNPFDNKRFNEKVKFLDEGMTKYCIKLK